MQLWFTFHVSWDAMNSERSCCALPSLHSIRGRYHEKHRKEFLAAKFWLLQSLQYSQVRCHWKGGNIQLLERFLITPTFLKKLFFFYSFHLKKRQTYFSKQNLISSIYQYRSTVFVLSKSHSSVTFQVNVMRRWVYYIKSQFKNTSWFENYWKSGTSEIINKLKFGVILMPPLCNYVLEVWGTFG